MWVAAHVYLTFKSVKENDNKNILLEENIVLMDVNSKQDVFNRIDELEDMFVSKSVYPGYIYNYVFGIRKIISVLNLDGDNLLQPSDKSEVTFELYEFADHDGVESYIKGKCIKAKMENSIKRQ